MCNGKIRIFQKNIHPWVRHNERANIMLILSAPGWERGVDGDRQRGAPRHPQPRGGPRVPDGRHLPLLLVGGMGPGQLHIFLLHHHDHHWVLSVVGIIDYIMKKAVVIFPICL